jgi:uncharacterized phage protein gp47/JayE
MAAFENRTIAEIRDLLIAAFQQEFNGIPRIIPRSFINIFSTVTAGVFIVLYKMIGWVFLQLFPETAYWKEVNVLGFKIRPLIKLGVLWGVGLPRSGTQWKGKIEVLVITQNTGLNAGLQLKSELTGKIYITDNPVILEGETAAIDVTCNDSGIAGNLSAGDILKFVSPLGGVKKEAVVTEVTNSGIDDESEADYRYRVVNRYRTQPRGGSSADYRIWASEVPGVLNIYPYNDIDSPAGVLLYVSGNPAVFPGRVPSAALLARVGEACVYDPKTGRSCRKPITAVIDPAGDGSYSNVRAVVIIDFDIYITGLAGIAASEFAAAARPSIEAYFLGREPYIRGLSDDSNKTNIVSKNNVSSIIDQIAVSLKSEFGAVTMKRDDEEEPGYTLGMGQLSRLNRLFINEEEY